MKKLISLLLTLVMVFSLTAPVFAANIGVSVDNEKIDAGDSVVVTITLEEPIDVSEGATMMQGELHYDGTVLEFVNVEIGENYQSAYFSAGKHKTENKILFSYLDTSINYGPVEFQAGTIVTVTFKALEDIAEDHISTYLEFKNAYVQNAQGENVGDLTYDAGVTVLVCKEHTWNEGEVTTAATCVDAGVMTYTCTFEGCGETKTEEIAALGHSYEDGVCTVCGAEDPDYVAPEGSAAPFTVTVGGVEMTEFTLGEIADPYNGTKPLYTFTIPEGSSQATISWAEGTYTLSYYDGNTNAYLGFESGMQSSWTVPTDYNGDGTYDNIQIYDSGYGVPYWITFTNPVEEEPETPTAPFTLTVGGVEMTEFTLGEITDPYNGTKPLYTFTIPEGSTEAVITWAEGTYTLSYYDGNTNGYIGFESGMKSSWTVPTDYNGDGTYDNIQIYDSGYGVPYWIAFTNPVEEEPETPTAPFTLTVGGVEMTEFTLGEIEDPYNGTKPLYTFTIPEGSTEATISWTDGTYTLSYYDGNSNAYLGFESGMKSSWTVPTDYNGDGTYDNIQIYDSGYGVPYWITFTNPVEEEPAESAEVTVYMTVNEKGEFITAPNGTDMALVKMTVPYFDLAEYGLEALYYNPYCYVDENGNTVTQTAGTKEDAEGVVTMLHLFIWATEVYYNELDPAEAGQGWLAENGWNGFEIWQQVPGSAFINFWSFGMNLNYYLNYEYPLGHAGWGSTLDQIALANGDIVSVRYNAATGNDGAYYHFGADGDLSKTTSNVNDVVLTMYQCTESLDYTTGHKRVGAGETVYVSPTVDAADAVATYTTDANGQITVDTADLNGTYYVFSDTWDPAVMYLIVESDSHVHSYTATVTEPTCEEDGYTTYACECGASYQADFVAATGHDFVDGVCTRCGEVTTIIPDSARFIDVTTDVGGGCIVEDHEVDENFKSYFGDYPYFHVVIPEDAQYLYITYPANSLTVSQWSYAQAVAVPLPWDSMNNYTSNLELQTVTNEDGTQTVSILVKDYITQIPNDGTGIIMYNENYNFGEMFTIGRQIPVGYYDVSIPTSDRYTVTGELIAQDGYTFNVSINDGYIASEDFAIKVNGETVATEPGDITLDSVTERVIITVEGVLLAPKDPNCFITVDLTDYHGEVESDSYLCYEGPDIEWTVDENHGLVPGESTTYQFHSDEMYTYEVCLCLPYSDTLLGFDVNGVECLYTGSYQQYDLPAEGNDDAVAYLQRINYTYNGVTYDFLQFQCGIGYKTWDIDAPGTWVIKPIIHEHSYEAVVTAPTCTEGGYTTYTCECGDTYTADETEALGHSYVAGICTNCGEADPDYVAPTVDVYFSLSSDAEFLVGEATGTVMGLKQVTVPYFDLALYGMESFYFSSESYGDDGDGLPGSDLAPGTPEYADGKITMLHLFIYATEVYYCGVDPSEAGQGYLYEQGLMPGDALDIGGSQGSSFINYIWGKDMNLNYYLNYEYPLASEGWGATSDQILLQDGDIVTLGHFTSWSFFNDSTSIFNYMIADTDTAEQGEEINLTLYHAGADFSGDYSTAHTVIDYCPDVYYIALDDMTSGDVTTWNYLGTADENGEIVLDTTDLEPGQYMVAIAGQFGAENSSEICSTPGGVLLTVEEAEHVHAYEAVVTAPTCTEGGYTTYTCSCGDTYVSDETEALGHTEVVDEAVPATCTETGLTAGSHCDVCGVVLDEQEETPALGHNYEDGKCTECGAEDPNYVAPHEHSYEAVVTAPTCTEGGYTTYTCSCGDTYTADETEALGHSYEDGECTVCGEKDPNYTEPSTPSEPEHKHSYGEWITVKDPTSKETGLQERYCECGAKEQKVIDKLTNPFTDVKEDAYYYEPVLWAVYKGVTAGIREDAFGPNNLCTRAQVVTFLWRAYGSPEPESTENPFTDVTANSYYYKAVLWAVENGITAGVSSDKFGPSMVCTRAQVVTFLWRAAGSPESKTTKNPFADVTEKNYYYEPVLWAVENGITAGVDATHFGSGSNCTRAQIVTFLYKAVN